MTKTFLHHALSGVRNRDFGVLHALMAVLKNWTFRARTLCSGWYRLLRTLQNNLSCYGYHTLHGECYLHVLVQN